jgi:sugar/nucleoside kinase (ribokinase family)
MFDVYGIGNAIVDVITEVDEEFLVEASLDKGSMTLIDEYQVNMLNRAIHSYSKIKMSGGSAANTIFATQAFGCQTAYACKLSTDENGKHFVKAFETSGIPIDSRCIKNKGQSGHCFVFVTPDAERTMATNLGVSANLDKECIDQKLIAKAKTIYIEGYLATSIESSQTAKDAIEMARNAGAEVAITLSDASVVTNFRDTIESFTEKGLDLLFCNEEECLVWAKTDRMDVAISALRGIAKEAYVTLGSRGSIAISKEGVIEVNSEKVIPVDTNGAGDMYAGACLYARSKNLDSKATAAFANKCAASIVQEYGARLENTKKYQELI